MEDPKRIIMPLICALIKCENEKRILYGISLDSPVIKTKDGTLKVVFMHFLTKNGREMPYSLTSRYRYIAFPRKNNKIFLEDKSGSWLVGIIWMLLASKEPIKNIETALEDPYKLLWQLK